MLQKEIGMERPLEPVKEGFIIMGGGVGDSYQPVDEKYQLAKKTLEHIEKIGRPVHVLTKSTLVERDLDILKRINDDSRAILSMSFSTVDDDIAGVFEPGVPSPSERLETLRKFKDEGIACGIFLLPCIPLVSDSQERIEESLKVTQEFDYVVFGGMTLKPGRQREHFLQVLENYDPELVSRYSGIYSGDKYGNQNLEYYKELHGKFFEAVKKYPQPIRIPNRLFSDILNENDLVTVMLDHMDFAAKLKGQRSPYGYGARSIAKLDQPLSSVEDLKTLKGVGPFTEKIINSILETGTSEQYEKLMEF
jgi:DNA repair photolyase